MSSDRGARGGYRLDLEASDINMAEADRQPMGNRVIRRHGRGIPRQRQVSDVYYEESQEDDEENIGDYNRFPEMGFGHHIQNSYNVKNVHSKQSRRLPMWVWYILTRLLGVRIHPADKPIIGTIMHAVTLTFAIGYVTTFTWYTVYDIMSKYTKQTVLTGVMAIMIVIYWCALGIYANKLAAKLFSSQKFVESVRLHTRTVFKISAAGLMIIIATAVAILNNYTASSFYRPDDCRNITLSAGVCYAIFTTRVGFSVFSLLWNLLVGIVLLSVCRTHTIGIRRFIKQLEEDGRLYELYIRNLYRQGPMGTGGRSDVTELTDDEHYEWDNHDLSPLSDEYCAISSQRGSPIPSPTRRNFHLAFLASSTSSGQGVAGASSRTHHAGASAGKPAEPTTDGRGGTDDKKPSGREDTDLLVDVIIDDTNHPSQAPPGTTSTDVPCILTGASGVAMATIPSSSPCHISSRSSPAPVSAEPPKPRPFRPENRPIIIIKEGSISASEDTDSVDVVGKSTEEKVVTTDTLKPEAPLAMTRQEAGQDGRSDTDRTLLINPDPPSYASRSTQHSMRVEVSSPRHIQSSVSGDSDDSSSVANMSVSPNMLTPDNILLCYWRIGCRLRATSIALQRWLMAWVFFILLWSMTFILTWISHKATLLEIASFVLPILLLPLVCCAYGEVNMEGRRMLQSVCPTEERVHMLLYLENQPLALTAFGFPINYSTIMKTIGALAAAFFTKIILEEFNVF